MKRVKLISGMTLAIVAIGLFGSLVTTSHAEEESQRFLEALRDRGYYDVAIEYLESAESDPLVPREFKLGIDYEMGVTLIEAAKNGRVASIREQQLDDARKRLEKFRKEKPTHKLAKGAATKLADVLVEQGRVKMQNAQDPKATDAEKKKLTEEGRAFLQQAIKVYVDLENQFLEAHHKYPEIIDQNKEATLYEEREQVRRDLLNSRLQKGNATVELAKTYPEGSDEYKKEMLNAAKHFNEFWKKYDTRLAGMYARMWEGDCHRRVNDYKSAHEAYDELLELMVDEDAEPFRILKNKIALAKVLTLSDEKKYDDAVKLTEEWLKKARPDEEESLDGLSIQYYAALAASTAAEALKDPSKEREKNLLIAKVKKLLRKPARVDSLVKSQARDLQDKYDDGTVKQPETFAEAKDEADGLFDDVYEMSQELDEKAGDTEFMAEFEKSAKQAITMYNMAIKMRPEDVNQDIMSTIRRNMSFIYFAQKKLYEAAIVGEFLAKRYPENAGARDGAMIALSCWQTLNKDLGDEGTVERQKMLEMAEYITGTWEGTEEAQKAWMMLVVGALADRRVKDAIELIPRIPEDLPQRAQCEINCGLIVWSIFVKAYMAAPVEKRPEVVKNSMKYLETAKEMIVTGLQRMKKQNMPLDSTAGTALLTLIQLCQKMDQPEEAIKWLNDPEIGAMTLLKKNDPAVVPHAMKLHRAALDAYMKTGDVVKIRESLDAMQELYAGAGGESLTKLYLMLAMQLEKDLKESVAAESAVDPTDTEAVAAAMNNSKQIRGTYEELLTRVADCREGQSFGTMLWIARRLVTQATETEERSPEKAATMYTKAKKVLEDLLAGSKDGTYESQPGAEYTLMVELARIQMQSGDPAAARDQLIKLLNEKEMMISAQIQCAYAFQKLGSEEPMNYLTALRGDKAKYPNFWGWGLLSKRILQKKDYREQFHEARYNLALCRFEMAKAETVQSEQTEGAKQAMKDIRTVYKILPKMGEEQGYRTKYDGLLKKIQAFLGEDETGLKGWDEEQKAVTTVPTG